MTTLLAPLAVLALWTLVMLAWMVSVRLPAMRAARLGPETARHVVGLDVLPQRARSLADNYNHLLEQPTAFYAVVLACHLAGLTDVASLVLAWGYVGLRIVHSLVQVSPKATVVLRFQLFCLASAVLVGLVLRLLIGLL